MMCRLFQKKKTTQFYTVNFDPLTVKWSFFAPKCLAKITVYQITQNLCKSFNLRSSTAAAVSSKVLGHQPSETSPEQLLGHDQPKTNQQCYRPVVLVDGCVRRQARNAETTTLNIMLILWCVCWKLYFCHELHWKCCRYWCFCFWVVQ